MIPEYMTKRKVWWVLVDERGRLVTEDYGRLSTYESRQHALADAEAIKSTDGLDLRPKKIRIEV